MKKLEKLLRQAWDAGFDDGTNVGGLSDIPLDTLFENCMENICENLREEHKGNEVSEEIIFAGDRVTTKVTRKDGKIKVRAGSGYAWGVDKLCTLKDTGNGFIAKIYRDGMTHQPLYYSLDYSHASYLLIALLTEYWLGDTFDEMEVFSKDVELDKDKIKEGIKAADPEGQDICPWSFEEGVRFALNWAEEAQGE